MVIRDSTIRSCLLSELRKNREFSTIIKPEMQVGYGDAIIDIAVIKDTFYGFEIKSEVDSLQRLRNQVKSYDTLFTKTSLVLCENHYEKALNIVPSYWGIIKAVLKNGELKLLHSREASLNPNRKPIAFVQLLWRNELLDLCEKLGVEKKYRRLGKFALWEKINPAKQLRNLYVDWKK